MTFKLTKNNHFHADIVLTLLFWEVSGFSDQSGDKNDGECDGHHTAPEWGQAEKLATLSFSAFLVVCDQDKKPHVG